MTRDMLDEVLPPKMEVKFKKSDKAVAFDGYREFDIKEFEEARKRVAVDFPIEKDKWATTYTDYKKEEAALMDLTSERMKEWKKEYLAEPSAYSTAMSEKSAMDKELEIVDKLISEHGLRKFLRDIQTAPDPATNSVRLRLELSIPGNVLAQVNYIAKDLNPMLPEVKDIDSTLPVEIIDGCVILR